MSRERLEIKVCKLIFEEGGLHGYKWEALYTTRHNEVVKKQEESKPTIQDLLDTLSSWFGGELKDLNNDVYVEVTSGPTKIIGDNFLATKQYHIIEQLNSGELLELTRLLNQLPVRAQKADRLQKLRQEVKTLEEEISVGTGGLAV